MMKELDARRLLCPMPVIKVQDMVANEPAGTIIKAICTDPGVLNDIPSWCRINGHTVISAEKQADDYIVILEVGEE